MEDTETQLSELWKESGFSHGNFTHCPSFRSSCLITSSLFFNFMVGEQYSQARMTRLFDVCGNAFNSYVQSSLANINFWCTHHQSHYFVVVGSEFNIVLL